MRGFGKEAIAKAFALAGRRSRSAVALVNDSRQSGAVSFSRWDAAPVYKI